VEKAARGGRGKILEDGHVVFVVKVLMQLLTMPEYERDGINIGNLCFCLSSVLTAAVYGA